MGPSNWKLKKIWFEWTFIKSNYIPNWILKKNIIKTLIVLLNISFNGIFIFSSSILSQLFTTMVTTFTPTTTRRTSRFRSKTAPTTTIRPTPHIPKTSSCTLTSTIRSTSQKSNQPNTTRKKPNTNRPRASISTSRVNTTCQRLTIKQRCTETRLKRHLALFTAKTTETTPTTTVKSHTHIKPLSSISISVSSLSTVVDTMPKSMITRLAFTRTFRPRHAIKTWFRHQLPSHPRLRRRLLRVRKKAVITTHRTPSPRQARPPSYTNTAMVNWVTSLRQPRLTIKANNHAATTVLSMPISITTKKSPHPCLCRRPHLLQTLRPHQLFSQQQQALIWMAPRTTTALRTIYQLRFTTRFFIFCLLFFLFNFHLFFSLNTNFYVNVNFFKPLFWIILSIKSN